MPSDERPRVVLRAYSDLFRPDRRIHAIDGHRLPVPGGVPVGVVGYLALVILALAMLSRFPFLGDALALLHPSIHWGLAPAGIAIALWHLRPDGRSAPAAAVSRIGAYLSPARRHLAGRRLPTSRPRRHRVTCRLTTAPTRP